MLVEDIDIILVRKSIRSIRLAVAPDGKVRLSVPHSLSLSDTKSFVIARLPWIRKHLLRIKDQKALEPEDFSSVLFFGDTRQVCLTFQPKKQLVFIDEKNIIQISAKTGSTPEKIKKILDKWYVEELSKRILPLVSEWEPIMRVKVADLKYRRMKSRWGTCNVITRHIVLNTELVKKPFTCVEYILVHEMSHLLERGHGTKFKAVMDKYLPHWRQLRKELNDKVIIP